MSDHSIHTKSCRETNFGELGGFTGSSFTGDDDHLMCIEQRTDFWDVLRDG